MKNIRIISVCFLFASVVSCRENISVDIQMLDDTLAGKEIYENHLLDKINTLNSLISESSSHDYEHLYSVTLQLAEEYSSYSYDSTIVCCHRCLDYAEKLGDVKRRGEALLLLAMEDIKAGYYLEAVEIMRSLDVSSLDESLIDDYYFTYWKLSGEMMSYSPDIESREEFRAKFLEYGRKAQDTAVEESYRWWYLKYSEKYNEGDCEGSLLCARKMLDAALPHSKEYAEAAYYMGISYCGVNVDSLVHYYSMSAMTDVMLSTKDYASLLQLSKALFQTRDYNRSFRYMADHCMPDAIFFNGKLRPWQVSQFFPEIERAYGEQNRNRNNQIKIYLAMVSILSILIIIVLAILAKRQKSLFVLNEELKVSNEQMQESNVIKQEYITSFLSMLSENISSSRQYKNHVYRCIRSGRIKELEKEIESLPPIDKDIDQFNQIFDSTFVNIFPDFVDKFNELLSDGEQICLKGNELLTPELRIFALVRLGINDSRRIASLLHYSPNTIFNYRAKIRNKARGERDKFENEVMKIN